MATAPAAPETHCGLPARVAIALVLLPLAACANGPASTGKGNSSGVDPQAAMPADTWFGSLPLPGCGAADILLRLQADGAYRLQGHCRASLQALPDERGRWSIEWNGTCARLLPDGALLGTGAAPREFALAQDDLMVLAEGSCIEPVDDPRGRSLHRARDGD